MFVAQGLNKNRSIYIFRTDGIYFKLLLVCGLNTSCSIQIGGRVISLWRYISNIIAICRRRHISHSLVKYYLTRFYESELSCPSSALDIVVVGKRGGFEPISVSTELSIMNSRKSSDIYYTHLIYYVQ